MCQSIYWLSGLWSAIFLFHWCYCYIVKLEILFKLWRWVLEYETDERLIVLHVLHVFLGIQKCHYDYHAN